MFDTFTPKSSQTYNGVFTLIIINLVMYVLDHILQLPLERLYLNHHNPALYQFVTSLFCHASWQHLSGNLFFLYLFGKLVEEEEGASGVIISYLVCGIGANLMSWLLQSGYFSSLGASGAVFGLFSVSVLIRLSWDWRRLLEVLILGQFVIMQVIQETQQLGQADGVNRIAHLGGAFVGVVFILGLLRLAKSKKTS
ncbi:rhomboid family intramembrane serine protease [Beggiatoa leptomitoformis]|uniref:Rhomboid family intramembrane serine protease n=1 Tax=Beggiatoa leptomitoformis TaxID=288004 RepID=A0A2N9YEY1_9GAMM|nr:rhomboid family intramembrane serine protease [Beggiatoa leptomitoformis]ALG68733.1 rhomboid family intramembrane serine protease [Beggiatoa leptomitoformis]AUI68909.1 rhomboid family intramembrane serine protease [Beggiatoa leptomitoformis]